MANGTFECWLRIVDRACIRLCGMSINDLPDVPLADWYAAGLNPEKAAKRAIRMAKTG